jgi:hypothetical protein
MKLTFVVAALALVGCSASGDGADVLAGQGGAGAPPFEEPNLSDSVECNAVEALQTSVGCDYWAVQMDARFAADNGCFVAFVANTSESQAKIAVTFDQTHVDLGAFAKIPVGSGRSLTYASYDPEAGLAPGDVAILFLAGQYSTEPPDGIATQDTLHCPVPAAIPEGAQLHGTGIGRAFHIQTNVPVVAYQMLPYGGGMAAVTGATLLLPTSAWDKSYVAANAYAASSDEFGLGPSMDIVAAEDDTVVTMVPRADVGAGPGVRPAKAGEVVSYTLARGEVLQFTQGQELTGSLVSADKPVGLFAGHQCSNTPVNTPYCDHAEQQIPPVRALGSEYAAVAHRPRTSAPEPTPYRIIGAADGTVLSYEPAVGGPATLALGEMVEFTADRPFVVRSQDAEHPFLVLAYMVGADGVAAGYGVFGYGDPDVSRVVPPAQFLDRYVFFTDPTYPETNLVVVRKRGEDGFADVTLDCAGPLEGWAPLGQDGLYEFTRFDLVRHDFQPQGNCNTGRRVASSDEPFGLWVWGWGTPETQPARLCHEFEPNYSCYVSYAYPAGEGLTGLNGVELPIPK